MTPAQEKKLDDMHDDVLRIRSSLVPRLEILEIEVNGKGSKRGLKVEVPLLKKDVADIKTASRDAAQRKPSRTSNIIAAVALVIAALSPFIAAILK